MSSETLGYATAFDTYHRLGWSVVPLPRGKKKSPPEGFTGGNGRVPSYPDMHAWAQSDKHRDGNLAIVLPPNVVGIDVDHYGGKRGGDTIAEAQNRWGKLPPSYRSTSRADGRSGIRLFRIPEGVKLVESIKFPELGLGGVEIIQQHHRYVVCWPSIHPSGEVYRWYADIDGSLMDGPPAVTDIPELPPEWVEALTETAHNGTELPPDGAYDVSKAITKGEPSKRVRERLALAVEDIAGDGCRHDEVRDHVLGLLRYGKQGDPGVRTALLRLRKVFVNVVGADRDGGRAEAQHEFDSFIRGEHVAAVLADDSYDDDQDDSAATEQPKSKTKSSTTNLDRVLTFVPASEVISDIPDWVWEHDDRGRIQRAVLTLFAGRPGAGKSTGARWFAAQLSNGELGGCFQGKPQKVAYIGPEESREMVVKPGLQVAGANMDNIVFPEVTINGEAASLASDTDERELTELLLTQGVTVVFVDPIMATIRRKVDIYRNNELREALAPWVRIAQRINGTVVGIVHLTKGSSGDVVSAINGSSGFGEVARCVFGFAKDPEVDGEHVMSQVKNSCGPEDLSLTYTIDVELFTADTGRKGLMSRFAISGDSDTSVSEILSSTGGNRRLSAPMQRVLDLVNSRDETTAGIVFEKGLAKSQKVAANMLARLYRRGCIDNPIYGSYCPKVMK